MRSDCTIDGLGYAALDPQTFETALHNTMATPVDVDTATVEKVQGTTRRSLEELEDAVAAAVERSGVGYLPPLVCFIPCD